MFVEPGSPEEQRRACLLAKILYRRQWQGMKKYHSAGYQLHELTIKTREAGDPDKKTSVKRGLVAAHYIEHAGRLLAFVGKIFK